MVGNEKMIENGNSSENKSRIGALAELELAAIFIALSIFLLLAVLFPAPVGTSDQAQLLSHAAAPWIFGPIQVMLLYLPPIYAALLIPLLLLIFLVALPWLSIGKAAKIITFVFAFVQIAIVLMLLIYARIE